MHLSGSKLRVEDPPAFDRLTEPRPRLRLRGQRPSRWGRTATAGYTSFRGVGLLGRQGPDPSNSPPFAAEPGDEIAEQGCCAARLDSPGRMPRACRPTPRTAGLQMFSLEPAGANRSRNGERMPSRRTRSTARCRGAPRSVDGPHPSPTGTDVAVAFDGSQRVPWQVV